jgi:glucose/arabinose dehydrogenase
LLGGNDANIERPQQNARCLVETHYGQSFRIVHLSLSVADGAFQRDFGSALLTGQDVLNQIAPASVAHIPESFCCRECYFAGDIFHGGLERRDGLAGLHLAQFSRGRLADERIGIAQGAFDQLEAIRIQSDGPDGGDSLPTLVRILVAEAGLQHIPRSFFRLSQQGRARQQKEEDDREFGAHNVLYTEMKAMLKYTLPLFAAVAVFGQVQQQEAKLPAPYATPTVTNPPKVVGRPSDAQLKVPQGFVIEEYATDFNTPRFMYTAPGGEILVSDSSAGTVYVLVDKNKSYKDPERKAILTGLDRPYGLAIWKDYLYVGEPTSVKRYKYDAKNLTAGPGEQIASLKDFKQGHWTRSLLFDSKGEKLYVGVGSGSNVNTGEDPMRAAINRFNPDGSGHEIFASGTRNPIGLHWYPGTDTLWAAVQERDALGDDLVPDFFTHIQQGAFYGWPYAYSGPHEEPRHKGERPDLVAKTTAGDILLQSHVAVLDFLFYTGKQFPAEYQGGAFLAFHGSWNRSKRVGYEVGFIPFKDGKPSGAVQEFLTGWMISPESREVWGRPVAIMQLPDGSILVSDDGGKKIWRISYRG